MTRKRVQAIDFKAGKPTRWQAFDTVFFEVAKDASQRRMTPEGFMVVPANISCAGNVQEYSALELGIEGTNRTVRLFRPKDEVFNPKSYSTFERQTLTNNHPDGDVSASNYRSVTAGDVHDVAPADDTNLGANLYVKDSNTIEMVVSYGKNQLSCGYSFVLDMTPGTTPDGQSYDGVMRDIVGNHVAIVWNARGGPGLRVADHDPNNPEHTAMKITVNGITFDITDATLPLIEREVKTLTDARDAAVKAASDADASAKKADAALATATDAATKAKTANDAALAEIKAKIPTEAQVAVLAEERAKVVADARTILGEDFDDKGKGVAAIRIATLDHILANEPGLQGAVKAVLEGIEPAKANVDDARRAFNAALGVAATGAGAGPGRRVDDETSRAFAPDPKRGVGRGKDAKSITGEELFAYRQTHGGKNPPGYSA